jgi:hypothetical protein
MRREIVLLLKSVIVGFAIYNEKKEEKHYKAPALFFSHLRQNARIENCHGVQFTACV